MPAHKIFSNLDNYLELNLVYKTRVFIENNIYSLSSFVLLEQEKWFEREVGFCMQAVSPGSHAMDLGANIGIFTTALAKACGKEGRVVAVEPGISSLELLRRTAKLQNDVPITIKDYAIGEPGYEIGFVPGNSSETSKVSRDATKVTVPLKTFDQAFTELGWDKLDFVKMDIEGSEEVAILHGKTTLSRHSPLILLEIRDGKNVRLNAAVLLERLGYAFYRFVPGLNAIVPTDLSPDLPDLNIFAVPQAQADVLEKRSLLLPTNAVVDDDNNSLVPFSGYFERMAPAQADPKTARRWRRAFESEGSKDYLRGLAALLGARRVANSLGRRYDSLRRADILLTEAVAERRSISRLLSLLTCKVMLGDLHASISLAPALFDLAFGSSEVLDLDEPIIPPEIRMEKTFHGTQLRDWSQAAALLAVVFNGGLSSFYNPQASLRCCSKLINLGYGSADIERRKQLSAILIGQQEHAEPSRFFSDSDSIFLNQNLWSTV